MFQWRNTETGETILQDKFKRLREPFEYLGEAYRQPDAEQQIERIENSIQELEATSELLPVDRPQRQFQRQ